MDHVPILQSAGERWSALRREQKVSIIIFCICGLLALGLSIQHLGSSITDPFTISKQKIEVAKQELDVIDPSARLEAEARRRDTDGDGISDWDEEHVYRTSPYLRDTDGDSAPDNVELALGTNPNCVAGKPCTAAPIDVSALASSTPSLFDPSLFNGGSDQLIATFQQGINQGKQNLNQQGGTSTEIEPTLIRDPKAIRAVLLSTGKIDQAVIQKLTDTELLNLYDTVMVETSRQQVQQGTGITDPFTHAADGNTTP